MKSKAIRIRPFGQQAPKSTIIWKIELSQFDLHNDVIIE